MTKTQLIEKAAKDSGLTKKSITEAYDAISQAITDTLVAGEAVQLTGLVTISVKSKEAHVGRNPKTNETIQIPATRRVTFTASKTLKEKLN